MPFKGAGKARNCGVWYLEFRALHALYFYVNHTHFHSPLYKTDSSYFYGSPLIVLHFISYSNYLNLLFWKCRAFTFSQRNPIDRGE